MCTCFSIQLQEAESGLRKKEEIRQARLAQSVAQAAKTAATRAAAAPPTTSARPTLAASTSGRSRINRTFISAFGMAPVSGQAVSSTLAASTTNTAAQSEALARARVLPLRGGWVETNFSKTTQNVLISATKQAQAMDAEAKIGDTATKFEAERQKLCVYACVYIRSRIYSCYVLCHFLLLSFRLSYISPAALLFSSSDVTIDTLSTATSETTDSCLRIVLPKKGARVNAASVSVSSSNMYFADPLTRSVAVHAADTSFVALTPTIGETAQVAMIARLPAFDALRKPIQTYANVEDHSVEANKVLSVTFSALTGQPIYLNMPLFIFRLNRLAPIFWSCSCVLWVITQRRFTTHRQPNSSTHICRHKGIVMDIE